MGAREMDRLLSALPRFLQDGNQETRHHAKAMVAVLLDSCEVGEPRLRREIPPPIFERLQRELLSPSLLSDYTAPPGTATIGSRSSSSSSSYYGSRNGRNAVAGTGVINRRLGSTGPASANGLASTPGLDNASSNASGGGGSGGDKAVSVSGGGGGSQARGTNGAGGQNRWTGAGGDSWRWMGDAKGRRARGGDDGMNDDGIGLIEEVGSRSASSPPYSHRSPPPSLTRSRITFRKYLARPRKSTEPAKMRTVTAQPYPPVARRKSGVRREDEIWRRLFTTAEERQN
ncbi:unnamed protein product [Hapterophycus canaliculatus]